MDLHDTHWQGVTEKLRGLYGHGFRTKDAQRIRPKLITLIASELPRHDKALVERAFDMSVRKLRVNVDWSRFICMLLSFLPGWWSQLVNKPGFGASTMLLLTDGSVMCQEEGGLRWKKLTPDAHGSYVNGTWSDLAPMHWTRRYYASAVLADGRVFVSGGEYSNAGGETNKSEIYDPVLDSWTEIASPPGWTQVGDAARAVLPDGRVLLGNLNDTRTAIYDPAADSWAAGPTKGSSSSEESWVLLPDDTVITVRCNSSRKADKYVAASNSWVDGGTLPTGIIETSSSEIGAGILLDDGRAFFAGANNHTALYTPPAMASATGTWAMGPDFPNNAAGQMVGCKDSPACLMTNGKVLITAGPVDGVRNDFLPPTYFFEYDGSALNRVSDPGNATDKPYVGRMLLLPTGQILFASQTDAIYVYNYFGCISASARPQITSHPSTVRPFHSYTLHGRLLNGLSQAVGYGDDASAATNYPLVRIRHLASGTVTYCRSFDHSTMGVGTGAAVHSTNFFVPCGIPPGPSEICVVANGIASPSECIEVCACSFRWPIFDDRIYAMLIGSLADGPLWVWGPHGPVPVDPWGPKVAAKAKKARDAIVKGLEALHDLGQQVGKSRAKVASVQPLAPDDDDEMEEADRLATKARRASRGPKRDQGKAAGKRMR
jgi:Kelch motif